MSLGLPTMTVIMVTMMTEITKPLVSIIYVNVDVDHALLLWFEATLLV